MDDVQYLHPGLPYRLQATRCRCDESNPEGSSCLPLLNIYTSIMADEVDVVDIEGDECDTDDG